MWVARFKLRHNDCPIVKRTRKFKVDCLSTPASTNVKGNEVIATTVCKLLGEESMNGLFINDLKKDKGILNFEGNNNHFVTEYKLGERCELVQRYLSNDLLLLEPTFNSMDNHEYWSIGAWTKKPIQDFYDEISSHMHKHDILEIKQKNLAEIFFESAGINLSNRQRFALETAYNNGYYAIPRKAGVQQLAKSAKLSSATMQEHLRKAEMKIIEFFMGKHLKKHPHMFGNSNYKGNN